MCGTCGCGDGEAKIEGRAPARGHAYKPRKPINDAPSQRHAHTDADANANVEADNEAHHASRMVRIEQDILAKNDAYAADNRSWFVRRGILALNLVSSPGSGKTALLVKTIALLQGRLPIAVIEGDQQTSQDAERIRAAGAPAVQINTGKGCHLEARMVAHALEELAPQENSLLMIENVGNLVCPAAFDLGEAAKVVILSVTEGEDKPLKYPDMFRAARLMLLNKCDLLPYVDFDVDQAIAHAQRVNPDIVVIRVSARSGEGMAAWLDWIEQRRGVPA